MNDFDYEVRPKRLTPSQRDAQEDREDRLYEDAYAFVYEMEEAAWEMEYPDRPFRPDTRWLHERVMNYLREQSK